jgi:hypothetical protein
MGAGAGSLPTLGLILEKTEQRFKVIEEFYKPEKEITKEDKYYMGHCIIILLTLREIEILENFLKEKKSLNKETKEVEQYKDILIPQYHFGIKKIYSFKFKHINIMEEKIQNFKKEIMKIHKELKKRLDDELITEQFNVSVIDDITSPMENSGFIFKIIEMSFDSDLHSLYIDYINEFIILKLQKNDIFTKEVLIKLKMIKYITQILLFIKIYIKLNGVTKDNLSKEELKECSKYITNDAVILTHFNLLELKKTQDIFKSDDIIKDNELALEELINFNKKIIDIINKIEKNIK